MMRDQRQAFPLPVVAGSGRAGLRPAVGCLVVFLALLSGCRNKNLSAAGGGGPQGAALGLHKSTIASAGTLRVPGPASDLRASPDGATAVALVNGQLPPGEGVPPPMRVGELWAVRAEGEPIKLGAGVSNMPGGWLFSDDSRFVMFLTGYSVVSQSGALWAQDLTKPAEKVKLGEDVTYYVASGDAASVAFVERGVLKAGPLPQGPFREIAGEVATAQFTADGKALYFRRRVVAAGGLFQVVLADEKRQPRRVTDQVGDFELNKDGSRVAYLAREAPNSRSFQLYVAETATLKSTKVADAVLRFRFSNDGKLLARIQGDDPSQPGELWLGSAAGGLGKKLGDKVKDFVFSPDGTRLAFRQKYKEIELVGQQVEKIGELVMQPLPDGPQQVIEKKCPNYLFSPDSKVLAYTATVLTPLYSRDLYVLREGDEKAAKIKEWLYEYLFTPASDRLLFRADCTREGRSCWLLSLDVTKSGQAPVQIVDATFGFKLSRDGKTVLATYAHTLDGSFDVQAVDLETRRKKPLDGNVKPPVQFLGNRAVYVIEEKGRAGLYTADL